MGEKSIQNSKFKKKTRRDEKVGEEKLLMINQCPMPNN
jgi:hypothetical protein